MINKMSIRAKLLTGFLAIATFTAISGILGIIFNNQVGDEGINIGSVLAPESYAVMEINNEVLNAHLKLEEVLAENKKVDFSDVTDHFERATWYCNAILNGGKDAEIEIIATTDNELKSIIGEVKKDIQQIVEVSKHRNELGEEKFNNHIVVDQKFDDVFESVEEYLSQYMQYSGNAGRAASNALFKTTHGHLLLQEFTEGDESIDQDEIIENFDKAVQYTKELNTYISNDLSSIVNLTNKMLDLSEKRISSYSSLRLKIKKTDEDFDKAFEVFTEKAHEAEAEIISKMKEDLEHQKEISSVALFWMILISVVGFILAIIIAVVIVNNITKPIDKTVDFATEVAKGNLKATLDISQEDEIGKLIDSINNMVDTFKQGVGVLGLVAEGRLERADKTIDRDKEGDFNNALINLTEKLSYSASIANAVADGDLSVDVSKLDEKNELDSAVKKMIVNLSQIIGNILGGADNITIASQQMSGASTDLSQSSSEQAASVEEISSSMEEMSANNQQNTDNAKETEQISNKAATSIISVGEASRKSLESVKNIADKISVINDIAFQTNILALNAAVEAARAGEHGRGFAVVASEVRKLAVKSKDAAEEIVSLATTSVQHTEEASKMTENLHPEIQKTSMLVQEISASSEEQNTGYIQINNAIQQLNAVTQQNAASAEEMATGSEELASQAEQLKQVIAYFKTSNTHQFTKSQPKAIHSPLRSSLNVDELNKGVEINIDENKEGFEEY